jgi:hypothetical protein
VSNFAQDDISLEGIRANEKAGARTTTKADPYFSKLVEGFSTFRWIDSVLAVGYRRFSVLLHNFPTIKY